MYFAPMEIRLRDGRSVILCSPAAEDAAADLRCMRAVFAETEYMLGLPEDVTDDAALHARRLIAAADDPDGLLLLCVADGEVVARLHGRVKPRMKLRHRFHLGIAVRQSWWGQGVATAMMNAAEAAARQLGASRMELEVMAHNHRARALYERLGYRIVMTHPEAIHFPDGRVTDEYLMMKKL